MSAGVVDQDAAHYAGGHTDEVSPIFPIGAVDLAQAQVRFMDESGGLEGVVRAFLAEISGS
jgi:hypothetical protein